MSTPKIITLCGSTKFKEKFVELNRLCTLAGHIVLAPGIYGHSTGETLKQEEKTKLDRLHLAKIDLSSEVFVVNVGGYIGTSTARELIYAHEQKKKIRYLETQLTLNVAGVDLLDLSRVWQRTRP